MISSTVTLTVCKSTRGKNFYVRLLRKNSRWTFCLERTSIWWGLQRRSKSSILSPSTVNQTWYSSKVLWTIGRFVVFFAQHDWIMSCTMTARKLWWRIQAVLHISTAVVDFAQHHCFMSWTDVSIFRWKSIRGKKNVFSSLAYGSLLGKKHSTWISWQKVHAEWFVQNVISDGNAYSEQVEFVGRLHCLYSQHATMPKLY